MVEKAEWSMCVVVNDERIVLGLLRAEQLASGDEKTAEEAMRPGPSTFRPNVPIEEMAEHMIEHDQESAPITTPEGRLMGMLRRQDAAKVAMEVHHHHHEHEEEG